MYIHCFFKDTAATEIYTYRHTLSRHGALPISRPRTIATPAAPPQRRAARTKPVAPDPAGTPARPPAGAASASPPAAAGAPTGRAGPAPAPRDRAHPRTTADQPAPRRPSVARDESAGHAGPRLRDPVRCEWPGAALGAGCVGGYPRSEENKSELQSLMRNS